MGVLSRRKVEVGGGGKRSMLREGHVSDVVAVS